MRSERIPTIADLAPYVESGLVNATSHNGFTIYNYTKPCTYQRAWDWVTVAARGLIFDDKGRLVARPFPKFFNHTQPEAVIPDGPPDSATIKYDGSLGISYVSGGSVRWATRGSLTSPQAAIAQRVWDERHAERWAFSGLERLTLLVEILSPEIDSIIPAERDELVLIGAIWIDDGTDQTHQALRSTARRLGMRCADEVPADFDALAEAAKTLPASAEGWVLRWGNHRVKVKGRAYLDIARLVQSMQPRRVADHWYVGDLASFALVPEEFRGELEAETAALDALLADLQREVSEIGAAADGLADRDVAAKFKRERTFGAVMQSRRGIVPDLRLLAYRERHPKCRPRPVGGDDVEVSP